MKALVSFIALFQHVTSSSGNIQQFEQSLSDDISKALHDESLNAAVELAERWSGKGLKSDQELNKYLRNVADKTSLKLANMIAKRIEALEDSEASQESIGKEDSKYYLDIEVMKTLISNYQRQFVLEKARQISNGKESNMKMSLPTDESITKLLNNIMKPLNDEMDEKLNLNGGIRTRFGINRRRFTLCNVRGTFKNLIKSTIRSALNCNTCEKKINRSSLENSNVYGLEADSDLSGLKLSNKQNKESSKLSRHLKKVQNQKDESHLKGNSKENRASLENSNRRGLEDDNISSDFDNDDIIESQENAKDLKWYLKNHRKASSNTNDNTDNDRKTRVYYGDGNERKHKNKYDGSTKVNEAIGLDILDEHRIRTDLEKSLKTTFQDPWKGYESGGPTSGGKSRKSSGFEHNYGFSSNHNWIYSNTSIGKLNTDSDSGGKNNDRTIFKHPNKNVDDKNTHIYHQVTRTIYGKSSGNEHDYSHWGILGTNFGKDPKIVSETKTFISKNNGWWLK